MEFSGPEKTEVKLTEEQWREFSADLVEQGEFIENPEELAWKLLLKCNAAVAAAVVEDGFDPRSPDVTIEAFLSHLLAKRVVMD